MHIEDATANLDPEDTNMLSIEDSDDDNATQASRATMAQKKSVFAILDKYQGKEKKPEGSEAGASAKQKKKA
eukprot:12185109-Karenia_brevis.AAC.1